MAVRVLLASDARVYREGLEKMLGEIEQIVVVGEATCAEEAAERVRRVEPDVVLLDMSMEDRDLRVRPFFAHGGTISIREFVAGAFNDEMGLQAVDPLLVQAVAGARIITPSGMVLDGSKDTLQRPLATTANDDPDADGKFNEIPTALVDHMEFYLFNYFKPGTYRQTQTTQAGLQLMKQINCTACHVQNLTVNTDRRVADVETVYDSQRGIFNDLFATATLLVVEQNDGSGYPSVKVPAQNSFVVRNFFADMKRHDLGPRFHERNFNGTMTKQFMTEPLWGVGSTAPYGHDGRSINLREVILRHGGERRSRAMTSRLCPKTRSSRSSSS